MMVSDDQNNKKNGSRKVIDMTERLPSKNNLGKLKSLKVRLDLEQAKVAIPVSLLSILAVVTLLNSKILDDAPGLSVGSSRSEQIQSSQLASEGTDGSTHVIHAARGIASVPTGTSISEDQLVKELSEKAVSEAAVLGKSPSELDKFTMETLGGKYAVRINAAQRVSEIHLDRTQAQEPIAFSNNFIDQNRKWLAVDFKQSIRIAVDKIPEGETRSYQLVDGYSIPVANVKVDVDHKGRLLDLKVYPIKR